MSLIRGLNGSQHVNVVNGNPSTTYYNNGLPMSGMVRYCNNNLEVYDGNTWQMIQGAYPTVSLTSAATDAIDWAIKKMSEDRELERLSKDHLAVQAALDNVRKAQEQLKVTIILSKDEETTS